MLFRIEKATIAGFDWGAANIAAANVGAAD